MAHHTKRLSEYHSEKLETTKKIIIGSTVRVYRKGFGYSKLTIVENNEHYLAATAEETFFHLVQEGDIVEAYLWVHDVASYEFYLQLIGKIVIGPEFSFSVTRKRFPGALRGNASRPKWICCKVFHL